MKRLMLTIILIVVTSSMAAQAAPVRLPWENHCAGSVRVILPPQRRVVVLPRVYGGYGQRVILPWEVYGGGYGYSHSRRGYGLGRTSTFKGIAVAQTVFEGLALLMEHQQIDKDRDHEIKVLDRQLGR